MKKKFESMLVVISSIVFLTMIILQITGKGNLFHLIIFGLIKEGPIWGVYIFVIITGLLFARIVSHGFCYNIVKNKKKLAHKIYWITVSVSLIIQFWFLYLFRFKLR